MAPLTVTSSTSAAAVACLLLALAAAAAAASSRAPAPAPGVDCATAATNLVDCLDYVSPGSNTTRPGKACCGKVKSAVANPALVDCLCAALGSKDLPIPIDMKRVLALPGACGASNAAFSKCHIGAPSEAPAPSAGGPAAGSGGATASPPVPAAASSPAVTATAFVVAAAVPLLAYSYLF